jgi:hypothetical protein
MHSSSGARGRRPRGERRTPGTIDRQALRNWQQASAVKLRKHRQEERLASRRNRSSSQATVTTPGSLPSTDTTVLRGSLETLLLNDNNNATTAEATLTTLHQALTTTGPNGLAVLRELVQTEPEKARRLVQGLLHQVGAQPNGTALHILAILSLPDASPVAGESDAYYGNAAANLRYSDLLLESFHVLLPLWKRDWSSPTWNDLVGQAVAQDATAWSRRLLYDSQVWSSLVAHLPATSYVCAAILQNDTQHYGSFFLEHLTPARLAMLLQQTAASTDTSANRTSLIAETAWMIEGVARREASAVQSLVDASQSNLLDVIVHALCESPPTVQLPLVRAIGHMAVTQDGQYVPRLLSHTGFINAMASLLGNNKNNPPTTPAVLGEALSTLSCLWCDSGRSNHPATTIALASWLVPVTDLVLQSSFTIQGQALRALAVGLGPPPGLPPGTTTETALWTDPYTLPYVLKEYVYQVQPDRLRHLLQVLLDVLGRPDADVHLWALQVLSVLLQHTTTTRDYWLDLPDSLDRLEGFLLGHQYASEAVAERAADLLDDYFDDVMGGSDEEADSNWPADSMRLPPTPPVLAVLTPPAGRGRGRVLPAWMVQQQQKP